MTKIIKIEGWRKSWPMDMRSFDCSIGVADESGLLVLRLSSCLDSRAHPQTKNVQANIAANTHTARHPYPGNKIGTARPFTKTPYAVPEDIKPIALPWCFIGMSSCATATIGTQTAAAAAPAVVKRTAICHRSETNISPKRLMQEVSTESSMSRLAPILWVNTLLVSAATKKPTCANEINPPASV